MKTEAFLTVKEFADATGRFPNQIYDLINKGNRFRRLKSRSINGKIAIPKTELEEFPFSASEQFRIAMAQRLCNLEQRVTALETVSKEG